MKSARNVTSSPSVVVRLGRRRSSLSRRRSVGRRSVGHRSVVASLGRRVARSSRRCSLGRCVARSSHRSVSELVASLGRRVARSSSVVSSLGRSSLGCRRVARSLRRSVVTSLGRRVARSSHRSVSELVASIGRRRSDVVASRRRSSRRSVGGRVGRSWSSRTKSARIVNKKGENKTKPLGF